LQEAGSNFHFLFLNEWLEYVIKVTDIPKASLRYYQRECSMCWNRKGTHCKLTGLRPAPGRLQQTTWSALNNRLTPHRLSFNAAFEQESSNLSKMESSSSSGSVAIINVSEQIRSTDARDIPPDLNLSQLISGRNF
jgi:hypothetical protein